MPSRNLIYSALFLLILAAGGFYAFKGATRQSPAQIAAQEAAPWGEISLTGRVKPQSMVISPDGKTLGFTVTDGSNDVPVIFTGGLPAGFCEGQSLTVRGNLQENKSLSAYALEIPLSNKC